MSWARGGVGRLLRHPVLPLAAEGFLSRLSFAILSFALPLLAYQMGMSLPAIGVLLSLNLVVGIALKPLTGHVADRWGQKRILVASILLRSIVTLVLVVAADPWQLFAARALHGVAIALRDPATNVLVAEAGGERQVASSFAWYQTAKTLAGSFGRALSGIVLALTGGFRPAFVVAFVLSALPLVVVVTAVKESLAPADPAGTAGTADSAGRSGDDASPPERLRLLPFASVGFLITGSAYMMANLFPLYAVEYVGLSPATVGVVYLLGGIVALSGPLWGWLADHVSHDVVLSARGVANVGSSLLYLLVPNLAGVAVGKALDDAGKAAFRPAWGSLMAGVARHDRTRRARVMAWLSMGEDAGEVAGPIIAGLLWSAWGIPVVLVARMAWALGAEVVTGAVMQRNSASLGGVGDHAESTVGLGPATSPIRTDASGRYGGSQDPVAE